jgi:hypothetical protein
MQKASEVEAESIQMQYRYRIKYRHPLSGIVGIVTRHSTAEIRAERSRLEALGNVVIDVMLPFGEGPKSPAPESRSRNADTLTHSACPQFGTIDH